MYWPFSFLSVGLLATVLRCFGSLVRLSTIISITGLRCSNTAPRVKQIRRAKAMQIWMEGGLVQRAWVDLLVVPVSVSPSSFLRLFMWQYLFFL